MAKHHNKALSVLLASMMVASMCCVPTTTVAAASTTEEESGSTLASYYSTNSAGFGKNKTISVDGDLSDWDSSMLIAQGTANDDPRVYRPNSMYEVGIDLYALYGAYDDNNVYLMWEMTNVQDVVAPSDNYPLSQGVLWQTQELPFFIAVDTGKTDTAIGNKGALTTGGTIWDSGMTLENSFNKLISINTKGGNGPWVYGGDSTGLNPVELLDASTSKVTMDYGLGILSKNVYGINGAYGTNNGRVPGDVCNESADWVDFNTEGHSSSTMDFFYELAIPYDELGITKSDVQNNGIGVMLVATMGKSPMDCLPGDPVMTDQADLDDAAASQENNSFEKSDEDHITASFARIGKSGGNINPTDPTDPPVDPDDPTDPPVDPDDPTDPTVPSDVTGAKEFTVAEGDKVTFTVDVTTSKKIGSYLMTTKYDADAFELDKSYSTDGVSTLGAASGQEVVNTTVAGQVKSAVLSVATKPYTAADGATLQTVQLTAKKAGTYTISYTIDEMIDESENDLVSNNKPLSGLTVSEKATVNGETPVDVETGSTTASFKAGDTVEYYVDMQFAKGLYGFQTDVSYDSSLLEFVSAEYPNFDGTIVDNTDVAGKFSVIGAGTSTKTYDFTTKKNLVKVTFKALADATDSKISYTMKQTMDAEGNEYINPTTGQPISTDVSTSNSAKVVGANPIEGATTASTDVTVKAGDKVNYWIEITIPEDKLDVAGWTAFLYYDEDVFDVNMDFADGKGFATGTAAVDYALGLSNTAVALPGGSGMMQATFKDGRVNGIDVNLNGFGCKGKTTKLFCIQLEATKDATTTLAYRMRDLADTANGAEMAYVDSDGQPRGGASFALKTNVIRKEPTGKMIYLQPNANWIKGDARFAVQVSGASGTQWISMTDLEDGYFGAEIPAGDYTEVKFARMNPKSESNTATNIWNYTSVMTIPTDGTNCYSIYAGEWNDAAGEWSVYISKASLKKLYLKPNANWIKTDARFAMQVFAPNGASEWVSMDDAGDGYYTAYVPTTEYTEVKFARMYGGSPANTAANIWNYSSKMTFPVKADEKNCFFINDGEWNDVAGSWGVFEPTVYEPDALYIKPNLNWTYNKYNKEARFSAYLYGGESPATWVSLTKAADGNYKLVIPAGDYKKLQFARMDVNTTANNWESLWNDSMELEIPTNGTNRFVLNDDAWSSAEGTWDSITELKTLYLKPNLNWTYNKYNKEARFSAYLYGGESQATWVSMTKQADGTYKADMPEGHYTKVIFVRMNVNTTENIWDNNWNESTPQRIPAHTTNLFTLNTDDWNSAEGVWSAK